jgi:hypothetical protein
MRLNEIAGMKHLKRNNSTPGFFDSKFEATEVTQYRQYVQHSETANQ